MAWRHSDWQADHYAQRVGAEGEIMWGSAAVLFENASDPSWLAIVQDGTGGAIVTFQNRYSELRPGEGYVNYGSIYAQRVDGEGVVRWNLDLTREYPKGGIDVVYTVDGWIVPKMVSDGTGGAIISWPYEGKIHLQHINEEGKMGVTTSVSSPSEDLELPNQFRLAQNVPNPFNPTTTIAYDIPQAGDVTMTVYTITGQKVAVLVDGHLEAGHHSMLFEGSDFGTGAYLYRLEAEGFVETRRMVLLR
ncbi:MAG: T9SS type A sorting domain-containing protein [Candidatus Latescibacterota bacterium]